MCRSCHHIFLLFTYYPTISTGPYCLHLIPTSPSCPTVSVAYGLHLALIVTQKRTHSPTGPVAHVPSSLVWSRPSFGLWEIDEGGRQNSLNAKLLRLLWQTMGTPQRYILRRQQFRVQLQTSPTRRKVMGVEEGRANVRGWAQSVGGNGCLSPSVRNNRCHPVPKGKGRAHTKTKPHKARATLTAVSPHNEPTVRKPHMGGAMLLHPRSYRVAMLLYGDRKRVLVPRMRRILRSPHSLPRG
ncbi:hypothetical protein XELAEV_18041488mg [Xenopus laevis]|uniref:Uncharacterized protein n=1 Tax=Xenopus laevis TaxID=8355 RepID=A0A974C247_XENLA|nr:hypothetical protein XELAEV_18041488mg [Xenopus laevis]